MRLLATLAAVSTVNAFLDDNFLLRTRREDDECDGIVVHDMCVDSAELAAELSEILEEADEPDTTDAPNKLARKFPMGSEQSSSGFSSGLERTKRRSQRMTLLLAKVVAGGQFVDQETGKKIRSKEFIKRVNNYGCHCWPSQTKEHLTGHGKGLDSIDETCMSLKKCHKCVNILYPEGEDRPEGCDPVSTKYKAQLSKDGNGGLSITCKNTLNKKGNNNGDCKRSLCECDKAFADSFANNFSVWAKENWKLEENGTYDDMCVRTSRGSRTIGSGPDSCCGNFPDVKAYNSATHSCVDGVVTSDNVF
jgi:hypothetical protein